MAKTARKNRKRNAKRRARELKAAMRGEGPSPKVRNVVVQEMIANCRAATFKDRKKEQKRRACRTKVSPNDE